MNFFLEFILIYFQLNIFRHQDIWLFEDLQKMKSENWFEKIQLD